MQLMPLKLVLTTATANTFPANHNKNHHNFLKGCFLVVDCVCVVFSISFVPWCHCRVFHSVTSCPFQARTEYLRKKARGALQSASGGEEGDGGKGEIEAVEHLNLFPLEESDLKKGNEDYLKEKKDEKVLLPHFTSLFRLSGSEANQTLLFLSTTVDKLNHIAFGEFCR